MTSPSTTEQLNWWLKRKLYRLGHYLHQEHDGVHARRFERYCKRSHTNTLLRDWASDFHACGMCAELDAHYLPPDNSYRPLPTHLKHRDRRFWSQVRQKTGLIREGKRILSLMYE